MPDSNTQVGANTSVVNPGKEIYPPTFDDPAIAVMRPMAMSAPIEQMPSDVLVPAPAAQLPAQAQLPTQPAPLSSDAAPFKSGEPAVPAVEYVTVMTPQPTPQSAPPQVQAPPVPADPAPPAPVQRPTVLQPVRPVVPAPVTQRPQPMIAQSGRRPDPVSPLSAATAPAPAMATPSPAASPAAFIPQVLPSTYDAPEEKPAAPSRIYSENTRAVWHARRGTKLLYISALLIGVSVIGTAFLYWVSAGSPTDVSEMPFIQDLVR